MILSYSGASSTF